MNDCEDNKSAYDTCVPFVPILKYDKKTGQCILGGKRGIPLKDQSNPDCDVKYNVKIYMNVDDSSTLYLHFSDDGGKTFYTEGPDDSPRVATKDELERTRRRQLCSSCKKPDWMGCAGNYQCSSGACRLCNSRSCDGGWVCCPPNCDNYLFCTCWWC